MKTVGRCQLCRSGVFIVKCEHVLHFVLIADFEQARICWVTFENTNIFEGEIRYIMCYVVIPSV